MKLLNEKLNKIDIAQVIFYSMILILLRVDLIFLDNTPTGGDMGAHVVPIKYFIENFASSFKINGWSNDWFAGYPLYFFYFPFPAILTYLINLIIPFGVAFKIMVAGSVVLIVYSIEKLFRKEDYLFSYIGIGAGLMFALTESFTIYGGNLASTLAGQFSFTYSLAFANLAIYYITKSKNKYKVPLSSIFLSLCLLSHLIPFILYLPAYSIYWLIKKEKIQLKLISIFIFTTLVTRFVVPLIYNLEFTTNMSYTPYTRLKDLIKPDILPYTFLLFLFLLGIFNLKKLIENKTFSFFEIYLLLMSVSLYYFVPEGALWNGRLVPFFNLGIMIIFFKMLDLLLSDILKFQQGKLNANLIILSSIIVCLYLFYHKWIEFSRYKLFVFSLIGLTLLGLLIFYNSSYKLFSLGVFVFIIYSMSFLPHWVNWNFTGYEGKEDWEEIELLYSSLEKLPPGRIMWEPNSELNKYGTPMVLMTIPLFTDHTSMEGLYFDSSITTPFHFIAVSGLAEKPSNPVGGLSYINNDFEKGVEYLQDFGVDYFISYTESITDKAIKSKDLNLLFTSEPFSVFEIKTNKIELVNQRLEIFPRISFYERTSSSIFRDTDYENFFQKAYNNFRFLDEYRVIEVPSNADINYSTSTDLEINDLIISSDKITFLTNKPNELHIIKVSYFPNWTLDNGLGPYRISPSFMAVIPYESEVVLKFERVKIERYSFYFGLISLFLSLMIFSRIRRNV
tara:strand:- start:1752 stop:3947 length:2196 start_codon:yes stop_codon:yes gene_type:complete